MFSEEICHDPPVTPQKVGGYAGAQIWVSNGLCKPQADLWRPRAVLRLRPAPRFHVESLCKGGGTSSLEVRNGAQQIPTVQMGRLGTQKSVQFTHSQSVVGPDPRPFPQVKGKIPPTPNAVARLQGFLLLFGVYFSMA